MKRRALLKLPLAALASFEASPVAAEPDQPRGVPPAIPLERFRFHAGALLLAAAGSGSDGAVCVGTAEGYIHALHPDGSFRWSYSVHGAVERRPILVGSTWLVATSAARIYALTTEGILYWVFKPPSPIASELAVDATGMTYFVGEDRFLYGLTAHGGVSFRAAFGELKAGPSAASDGAVWAENQAGYLLRVRGQDVRRVASPAREFEFTPEDRLRDPDGHEWRARPDGVLEFRGLGSAAPTLLELTRAPLLSPMWSPSGHYALISARDGLIVAIGVSHER